MARYVILLNWTDQGVATVKDTVTRYGHARQLLESMGGSFESIAWTVGPYDLVSIVEAPDEQTVAAFTLQLASGGNLRSLTMRAFTEDEMTGIIEKLD
ncbi:MAG TPA: GYD domain-containing protein [Gaiellales bacterium]|nr:GYD domain-containing protein [Gaiellales bacterium]